MFTACTDWPERESKQRELYDAPSSARKEVREKTVLSQSACHSSLITHHCFKHGGQLREDPWLALIFSR
jgi:hypothetical protein